MRKQPYQTSPSKSILQNTTISTELPSTLLMFSTLSTHNIDSSQMRFSNNIIQFMSPPCSKLSPFLMSLKVQVKFLTNPYIIKAPMTSLKYLPHFLTCPLSSSHTGILTISGTHQTCFCLRFVDLFPQPR